MSTLYDVTEYLKLGNRLVQIYWNTLSFTQMFVLNNLQPGEMLL